MKLIGTATFINAMEDLIHFYQKTVSRLDWELFLTVTFYLCIVEADIVSKETIAKKIKIGYRIALVEKNWFMPKERWRISAMERSACFSEYDPQLIGNIYAWIMAQYTTSPVSSKNNDPKFSLLKYLYLRP